MRTVITGASSGIGAELARELARRGHALALLARRRELLEPLAKECGNAAAVECDVTDAESVKRAVREGEERLGGPFDLAVANAGVSIRGHATQFGLADSEQIFRVNLFGMLYLFDAVIPSMVERKAGRFAGVASIAGLRGIPGAASYSASKAAMQSFLEASRVELAPYGVGITIINPGFVATDMTAKNKFKMPFLMTADRAARIMADGLESGKRVVEFPRPMSFLMRTLRHMPDAFYDRAMKKSGRRRSEGEKAKA